MSRVSDLHSILKLGRIVGQTMFGHFDHDASSAIGPNRPSIPESHDECHKREREEKATIESWDDPQTGEELFRPR